MMNNILKNQIVAVDFDGTLCEERYPFIGPAKSDVIEYVKSLKKNGCRLILWTCREGDLLKDAVTWCTKHGLVFDAVNQNLAEEQEKWGNDCRKVGANYFLDDRNLHIPGKNNYLVLQTAQICYYGQSSQFNDAKVFPSENAAFEYLFSEISKLLHGDKSSEYIRQMYFEGCEKVSKGVLINEQYVSFRNGEITVTNNETGNQHIFQIMKCEVM